MFGRSGCPATGRMMHRFDPETHRCKCGRWQSGFAPKCEPVKPRAECQICERIQAVSGGRMMNHGYQRPGIGFLIGGCPGVHHAPYPATDALEKYARMLDAEIERLRAEIANLAAVPGLPFEDRVRKKVYFACSVRRGAPATHGRGYRIPSFDEMVEMRTAVLENQIIGCEHETRRVAARIAAAAPKA